MTLNDLERQNGFFIDFLAISGCDTDVKTEMPRNQLR